MYIQIKRIYAEALASDGKRILVDRLWPRGISKQQANIDLWPKDITPSTELRKWYGHDPEYWDEFQRRYKAELSEHGETLQHLREMAEQQQLTLITAAKSEHYNHVIVLKQVLEQG
ncbi:DUF488 domain-containing protein [Acinetobacter bouvetii]|uniref:DUF488 family protein n=1 Tax=Acinetobacter bouvetii TaxID=202951 RepID=A0A811GC07_9GAMM|nr:DUF488 domain-containing protein [Acinetobacter bouvetii]CAB1209829.1 hypothetical protein SFB21_0626 [Acinetobacter bouvetii]